MKLFSCNQIAEIDRVTMQLEPIESIDLMERASAQIANWVLKNTEQYRHVAIFAGPGNNGGDALAVARMLAYAHYKCTVYLTCFGRDLKGDPGINWQLLIEQNSVILKTINSEDDFPEIQPDEIVIDGLFGSGLNKPLEGLAAKLVQHINQSGAEIISIDIPSGLFGEDNSANAGNIIQASHTLTLQLPKISFLFPENEKFVGKFEILPIGLHPLALEQTPSNYRYLTASYISEKIQKRTKFSHKGTYGHALLVAGSYGKMGAATLAARAALRAGVGLLTCHIPQKGYEIMQISVPEAMVSIDASETVFSEVPKLESYSAVGAGPGLGMNSATQQSLRSLLEMRPAKLILDADALNILSENKGWLELLPPNTILTPHPKEFERLAGTSENSFVRLQKQLEFSKKYKAIVVLKGAHSVITTPEGRVYFNSTGNPGMATAGSGDVLTGIVLGLLAQDYSPEDASLIGVFVHGLAGDLVKTELGENSLLAGDITAWLGKAFLQFE